MSISRRVVGFTVVGLAYLFGSYSMAKNYWPIEQLRMAKRALYGAATESEGGVDFDRYGRLTAYPGKEEVTCPAQTPRTMVLLAIGQSNTGNHAGQRYASDYDAQVLNYWNGKCFKAQSPLLGTTGQQGESWTLLGNKLIQSGMAEQVILVPIGIGGTPVYRWQAGGDLNKMMLGALAGMKQYSVTHILWHQGETDFHEQTSQEKYEVAFKSMLNAIKGVGVDAPVWVSVASKCGLGYWSTTNPVADAQKNLPNMGLNIFAGPNTDHILTQIDRYDDCHFSGSGQEKFAQAWVDAMAVVK